ncbi:WhiB family transcriptional regulator [Kineosporia babensis]
MMKQTPVSDVARDETASGPSRENNPRGMKPVQLTALLDALVEEVDPISTEMPCRVFDAELWFAESPTDVEHAKALCQDCPVRQECLAGALDRHEPWGVWGGELFVAGVVVPRKRPRGRPRKVVVAA